MSHHTTAAASNPTGAVEVVHVASSARSSAPVDGGAAGAAGAAGAVTTGSGGLAQAGQTQVEGVTHTRGANLPTDNMEQASSSIQQGKADLNQTAGAERRLDALNLVGGGGGGGGDNAGAGQQNANNDQGRPAQGNDNTDVKQMAENPDIKPQGVSPDAGTGTGANPAAQPATAPPLQAPEVEGRSSGVSTLTAGIK